MSQTLGVAGHGRWAGVLMLAGLIAACGEPVDAQAQTELVPREGPWRVWLSSGPRITRGANGITVVDGRGAEVPYTPANAKVNPLPLADWFSRDFDDHLWGRYNDDLYEYIGGYGCVVGGRGYSIYPAQLCLRSRFGVADPSRATDINVTVEYIGGVVVVVNGIEVGRSHLPAGKLDACSIATDYPIEAYTVEDGTTPLPAVGYARKIAGTPDEKWLPRYQARVRTFSATVPASCLVKGTNVLALQINRAACCGPLLGHISWSHLGVRSIRVTSASGAGVIAYSDAIRGPRVWSAQAMDTVTSKPAPGASLLARSWFKTPSIRGTPLKGIVAGNPFDPVVPIRILAPRNGVGHGQTVLSDPAGLRGVRASVGNLAGPAGAVLPATSVTLLFGLQGEGSHWCDDLVEQAPDGAPTVPVWLRVAAPRNQPPGWYVGTLTLEASAKKFAVPVQVFVTGYTMTDVKNFRCLIGVMHSPDTLAAHYKVQPWSDEHFRLMAKSLELAGQLGNDIMYVPVLHNRHMKHQTGLIRWVKTARGLAPDFSAFERYLDLYTKYCAAPQGMSLYVWSSDSAKEAMRTYEGSARTIQELNPKAKPQVTQWDPQTGVMEAIKAPDFLDEGAKEFRKPMLDGVHASVKKRGWAERVIMLGTGSDVRASQKTGELLRDLAPYARWDIYSHFTADPLVGGKSWYFFRGPAPAGSAPGKMITNGGLEVGMKEVPNTEPLTDLLIGSGKREPIEFLELTVHRCVYDDSSGPVIFRSVPNHGSIARVGLDFWNGGGGGLVWGTYPTCLAGRGPAGPLPTVRLATFREGMQDYEVRLSLLERLLKMPAEKQKAYLELCDELSSRAAVGSTFLSQVELSLDFPTYIARMYRAAEELMGIQTTAQWEQPPK